MTLNLRAVRERKGVTQRAAADLCGMGQPQYQKLEAGVVNVTFTTLARIARGLGVDPAELVAPPEWSESPSSWGPQRAIEDPTTGFVEWLDARSGMRARLREGPVERWSREGRWNKLDRSKLRSDVGTLTGSSDAQNGAVDLLLSFTDGRQRVVAVRATCIGEVLPQLRARRKP